MRLLVISNTPFLPPTAGNRTRLNNLLAHLGASGVELGMLMLPEVDLPEWDIQGMRARLAYFEVAAPPERTLARRALHRLGRLVKRDDRGVRPLGIDDWCPAWFRTRTARLVAEWRPDVMLVEYVFLSACLEGLPAPCLRIIDTHDLMHRRRAVYDAAGVPLQWFHTTRDEERRGLERADLVLAIQEEESAELRAMLPGRRVLTVPPGQAVVSQPLDAAVPGRVLLVASYNDLNVRGLRWFLAEVWPGLRRTRPDATLVVCGSIRDKLGDAPPGVELRGVVPTLAGEYARARVVINPVPAATGIQLKVADALCHGRPVVSTRAGVGGLGDAEGAGIVAVDGAVELAAAVDRLLGDEAYWTQTAQAAAVYAARHLAPEAAFGPLLAELRRHAS